ncbi:MAG: imelysin family protein [Rhodobacteraceae bacterium]|nr:imelysin family protein [Paracoccaceae bacterium]
MREFATAAMVLWASFAWADTPDVTASVTHHVLPGYDLLVQNTQALAATAEQECSASSPDLIQAYHRAFDSWISVSHLRFGPSESEDRAFALAFWPDPRGSTPKALSALIGAQDPAVRVPDAFRTVSVAARGFYALDFLLFDAQFTTDATAYTCALIQAVTTDIAANALAIRDGWLNGYADLMLMPGNDTYRTANEAAKQLFTALVTGLEFTSSMRLGRPLGTFERPRPKRAEARRSGRSLRHVILSLAATRDLALRLSSSDPDIAQAFDTAIMRAERLDDPIFASVSTPQGRLQVEILQQNVDMLRQRLTEQVGPSLGIEAGFNSLDGD